MKPTTILTGILIILIYDNVQGEFVTKPTNKVVRVNDSVIMECSSNDVSDICELEWKHYKVKSRTGDAIYYNGQVTANFKSYISIVNDSVGNCNLKINGTPSSAGTYQCVDMSNGQTASAELFIIDHHYNINGNVSECFAHYYGNCDPPMLQWMERNGHGWKVIDAVKTSSQNFVSINIRTPTQPFRCKIIWKPPNYFYDRELSINAGETTFFITEETTPWVSATYVTLPTTVNKNSSLEFKALSNASNESVSMAAIVAIVIGVFIVSCGLA